MIDKFTGLQFENWKPLTTDYSLEENLTYGAVSELDRVENLLLQWIHDKEHSLRPRTNLYTLVGKRCVDIVVSLFVIIFILSWLVPVAAIFICLDSSGPFYFIQLRTGRKGRSFFCLKFRTMTHDSTQIKFRQTLKNDSRITPTGEFLRRTNLDEMLQFINVLFGDMTLVGPRPHAVVHDSIYWSSDSYRARYLVKPGITGLAQIRGARGATTNSQMMANRVRYDHFYINKQTFMLDVKICVTTILMTFQGDTNAW